MSAASGEPEWNGERILSEIENAVGDASNSVHDSTEWWGSFFADGSSIYESYILPAAERVAGAYDRLAQQRDATERLCAQHEGKIHELRDQLAFAESALSGGLAENESLRARLAACERVIERIAAYSDDAMKDARTLHYDMRGWCRDYLTTPPQSDDDFGPNDGHARTVRRTPPQDAATTRGEG